MEVPAQKQQVPPVHLSKVARGYTERQIRGIIIQYTMPDQVKRITRNPEFVELVVNCAAAKPPVSIYGNFPFDPDKILKVKAGGHAHFDAAELLLALSHVDKKNKEIILSRLNKVLIKKYESVDALWDFLDKCAVSVSATVGALTVKHGNDFSITLTDIYARKKYAVEDLLKAENKPVVDELVRYIPPEARRAIDPAL